jgi:hypothetical protein
VSAAAILGPGIGLLRIKPDRGGGEIASHGTEGRSMRNCDVTTRRANWIYHRKSSPTLHSLLQSGTPIMSCLHSLLSVISFSEVSVYIFFGLPSWGFLQAIEAHLISGRHI